jgi:hypothetical protein
LESEKGGGVAEGSPSWISPTSFPSSFPGGDRVSVLFPLLRFPFSLFSLFSLFFLFSLSKKKKREKIHKITIPMNSIFAPSAINQPSLIPLFRFFRIFASLFSKKGFAKKGFSKKGFSKKGFVKKGFVKKGYVKKGYVYKKGFVLKKKERKDKREKENQSKSE